MIKSTMMAELDTQTGRTSHGCTDAQRYTHTHIYTRTDTHDEQTSRVGTQNKTAVPTQPLLYYSYCYGGFRPYLLSKQL